MREAGELAGHRAFNVDRFLDKFVGRESLIRQYVARCRGKADLGDLSTLDVPRFRQYLIEGSGIARDELLEGLYRACDLCTERGHEDLLAACREYDYDPDPHGVLPVECLSLKVQTENLDAFNLAYDRYALWQAERFSIYQGPEPREIEDPSAAAERLQTQLGEVFRQSKKSDRVLVRQYREEAYDNFVIYHERRTKAELVFEQTSVQRRISPLVLRPAQQDFISYNRETGQAEIETRFSSEESVLRWYFAECCLGQWSFFEGPAAADLLDLSRIADSDFDMPVDDGDDATLVEIHFKLPQRHNPTLVIRSADAMDTLVMNHLRTHLRGATILRVVLKIRFADDRRGKRVELAGTNKIKFKRSTHAEDVFRYLKRWGLLRERNAVELSVGTSRSAAQSGLAVQGVGALS